MNKKIIRRETSLVSSLQNLHPVLQRIYSARGVQSLEALERSLKTLLPYHDLKNIDQASDVLVLAIREQQKILIVGDYDADGATSTAVAVRALDMLGAMYVDYLVPNRFEYGYGLSPEIVQVAAAREPDLIITVDNGISSIEGVALANKLGINVLITDHHLAGKELPQATVIVNPNQIGDSFKSKNLAGVGVIFYVMLALRAKLRTQNWFIEQDIPEPNLANLLDIVALGTVADVVALDQNNRILVHQGLQRIRAGACVPGIRALIEVAKRDLNKLNSRDLGFALGPRLNAAGRLEDMSLGIECLLADDETRAKQLAMQLDQLNRERRDIENSMREEAINNLKNIHLNAQLLHGLCLFEKHWHQGVIGILASRIKDKVHRPVIAFAMSDEDTLKGSARSIDGLHIRDVLDLIATRYPGLLTKFGGHAMAAGLSLPREHFEQFSKVFNEVVAELTNEEMLQAKLFSDGELNDLELNLSLAELIAQEGPWGQAFPAPSFDGNFRVLEQRLVGEKHLKLTLKKGEAIIDAIAFYVDTNIWPQQRCNTVHLVYNLDVNEYLGRRTLQLIVDEIEMVGALEGMV